MKRFAIVAVVFASVLPASAATNYVSLSGSDTPPYSDWASAATHIQDAVDAASPGDVVLVTNGVYGTGGAVTPGYALSNRVCIITDITVESVNGPEETIIDGAGSVRGVYLSAGTLRGFTVTNGVTWMSGGRWQYDRSGGGLWIGDGATATNCIVRENEAATGGGVFLFNGGTLVDCSVVGNTTPNEGGGVRCEDGGTVRDCLIEGNVARDNGGGSYRGTLNNCLLRDNFAGILGGGSYEGTLNNCTVTDNLSRSDGGGSYGGTLNNCIVYFNSSQQSENNDWAQETPSIFSYCCTTPLPGGSGNITNNPQFVAAASGDFHLQPESLCIDAGTNYPGLASEDLDGNSRRVGSRPDMGAYEHCFGSGIINVTNANAAVMGEVLACDIGGTNNEWVVGAMVWRNSATGGSGTFPVSGFSFQVSSIPLASGANIISVTGTNAVARECFDHVTITRDALHYGTSSVHYVSLDGGNVWPYTNWVDAATTIQEAVDTAMAGDTVLVTNGFYDAGYAVTPGYGLKNCVCITNNITLQSVNGPEETVIDGSSSMRGVYLSAGTLSGFTVANGVTWQSDDGTWQYDRAGGGVWLGDGATATNCTVAGNEAATGGGAFLFNGGTLADCELTGNTTPNEGGGVRCEGGGILNRCRLTDNYSTSGSGGGSYGGTLNNCTFSGNSASYGGGSYSGTLNSCILSDNSARIGGGSDGGTLIHCTLTGNSAGEVGGGSAGGTLTNCIVWNNTAWEIGDNWKGSAISYSCATPLPSGTGNISEDPQFIDASSGNFHLLPTSPCNDAGTVLPDMPSTDFDGNPRLVDPRPDMGVYEDQSTPGVVDVTNVNLTVLGAVATHTIGGTNNAEIVGEMVWTNSATGGSGTFPAPGGPAYGWQVASIRLVGGENAITVAGTNSVGKRASDHVLITRDARHNDDSPVHYVSPDGGNVWPYTNWIDAATNIQEGVYTAMAGDTVLVTNGIYDAGKAVTPGYGLINRVCVTNNITLQSINGPEVTVIEGSGSMRGVYLSAGTLSGFTVTNGTTWASGGIWQYDRSGGGLWIGDGAIATNCTVTGNEARTGGGAFLFNGGTLADCELRGNTTPNEGGGVRCEGGGTVLDCLIEGNEAGSYGGGSYGGTLNNCTLTENSAEGGGGSYGGTLSYCTFSDNDADYGGGSRGGTLNNCLLEGNSAFNGAGSHSSGLNNCTLSGNSAMVGGVATSCTLKNCIIYGNTGVAATNSSLSYCYTSDPHFVDMTTGNYHLRSSSLCINAGNNADAPGDTDLDGNPRIIGDVVDIGAYETDLDLFIHITNGAVVVSDTTMSIDVGGTSSNLTGFVAWTNSANGTDGEWQLTGGDWLVPDIPLKTGDNTITVSASNDIGNAVSDSVVITRSMLHSGNSPTHYVSPEGGGIWPYTNWIDAATAIQDAADAAASNDTVWVADGTYAAAAEITVSRAFTIQSVNGPDTTIVDGRNSHRCFNLGDIACTLSGFTITNGYTSGEGGGIYCRDTTPIITRCVLTRNTAEGDGGGSLGGTLNQCILSGNSGFCGGGSRSGTLNNCLLSSNSAEDGGGSCNGTLNNCTLTGNSATFGGGSYGGTLNNCIVYFNTTSNNDGGMNWYAAALSYCCTTPAPAGGNITADPKFVNAAAGDFHLLLNSPCIDAGNNTYASGGTDLDGNIRIVDGNDDTIAAVDTGACEYDKTVADSDGDAVTDYDEYVADTDASDGSDWFRVAGCELSASATLRFQSSGARQYTLQACANLVEGGWVDIQTQTDIMGSGGEDSLTDPAATNPACFYRVQVEIP